VANTELNDELLPLAGSTTNKTRSHGFLIEDSKEEKRKRANSLRTTFRDGDDAAMMMKVNVGVTGELGSLCAGFAHSNFTTRRFYARFKPANIKY